MRLRLVEQLRDDGGNDFEFRGFINKMTRAKPRAETAIERRALITAHDHNCSRVFQSYIAQQIDTVPIRQINIQQNDIGLMVSEDLYRPGVSTGKKNRTQSGHPIQHSSDPAYDKRCVVHY